MNPQETSREAWVDTLTSASTRFWNAAKSAKPRSSSRRSCRLTKPKSSATWKKTNSARSCKDSPSKTSPTSWRKLEDEEVVEVITWLPPEQLADVLDEMEPDEAADLLGDLQPETAGEILALMEDKEEITPLLLHPDETAGGLMTSEYIALGQQMWAQTALEAIREWSPEHEYLYYFVVDKNGTLLGVVSLLQLIKADPEAEVQTFMDRNLVTASVDADQEECAGLMSRYDLTALPVVDADDQTHWRHHHRRHHRRHRGRGHRGHPAAGW